MGEHTDSSRERLEQSWVSKTSATVDHVGTLYIEPQTYFVGPLIVQIQPQLAGCHL